MTNIYRIRGELMHGSPTAKRHRRWLTKSVEDGP